MTLEFVIKSLSNLVLGQTFELREWLIIEDMVALMMWLLLVAVIGSLVVIAVVRPARASGQRASTVFTRRQAARERARLEQPSRSADERLMSSGRARGRARRSVSAPAAHRAAAARRTAAARPARHHAAAEPTAPSPEPLAAPSAPETPVVAGAQQPQAVAPPAVPLDDSVIDARTRWVHAEGDVAATPDPRRGSDQAVEPLPAPSEQLRRAE